MKKSIIVFIILFLAAMPVLSARVVPMPQHLKPFRIRVDHEQVFITEGPEIFIYSLKDFALQAKFGKAGEGPEEFKLIPEFSGEIDIQEDKILVSSLGRVSFFSRAGTFLDEKKTKASRRICMYRSVGDKIAGESYLIEGGELYLTVSLYDTARSATAPGKPRHTVPAELKKSSQKNKLLANGNTGLTKIKEIHRDRYFIQRGKQFNPIARGVYIPNFYIHENRIFIGGEMNTGTIHVYDKDGKKLYIIDPGIDKVKFTEADKKGWIDSYFSNAEYKRQYERLKDRFHYPEFFPLWQNFIVADKKIYVQTYKRDKEDKRNEFFILDLDGKLIKKVWLPMAEYFDFTPNPYTINGGKLYRFVENEEKEEFELHITDIK